MEYIKINDQEYEASIIGRISDLSWGGRSTKTITLTNMESSEAAQLFVDGVKWSIIIENELDEPVLDPETGEFTYDEDGNIITQTTTQRDEFDSSEFEVAGPITDNRDGTITVKMGKKTELEKTSELMEILLGEKV